MQVSYQKYILQFKIPGGTSRGVLRIKDTYIIQIKEDGKTAYGECALFRGLSYDDRDDYEEKLEEVCRRIPSEKEAILDELREWPSIRFGVETLLKDWRNGSKQVIFPESISAEGFTVPINALIWMGSDDRMKQQIEKRLDEGYTSIKLKIGAIDFESELALIKLIRDRFGALEVEIRLDANGAFTFAEAKEKIKRLSEYGVNYIEQPIKAGQWQEMAALAEDSPVKIALDEELIGITDPPKMVRLIETIAPQGLIIKPALVGGFSSSDFWKDLIARKGGFSVVTSALESNIGLNAIAQYTACRPEKFAQGLGTGGLFTNNFPAPYTVDSKGLHYHCDKMWDFSALE